MKKISLLIAGCCIVFLALGCAHGPDQKKPPEDLFAEATKYASKGRVERATELFLQLRTYYPGHTLAREALLAMADLSFEHAEYDVALSNYREFRLLYPTDPQAVYSLFRMGMCHFNQKATFDRDQTEALRAIYAFQDLLDHHPDSPYAEEARTHIREARIVMAQNTLYIGKFYLKKKNTLAACRRFREAQRLYSGLGFDEEIDNLISRTCGPD